MIDCLEEEWIESEEKMVRFKEVRVGARGSNSIRRSCPRIISSCLRVRVGLARQVLMRFLISERFPNSA